LLPTMLFEQIIEILQGNLSTF